MTVVVEAESLTKRFGEVSAVTDLSFALEAGTITGFQRTMATPAELSLLRLVAQGVVGPRRATPERVVEQLRETHDDRDSSERRGEAADPAVDAPPRFAYSNCVSEAYVAASCTFSASARIAAR